MLDKIAFQIHRHNLEEINLLKKLENINLRLVFYYICHIKYSSDYEFLLILFVDI